MAWGVEDVSEQRLKFVLDRRRGEETVTQLCRRYEISRPTGYLWLARAKECARLQEIGEKSRRPHHSPKQTPEATVKRVLELRAQRPDWGAKKLRVLLQREQIELPVVTIHRILLREGLVRGQDRHWGAVKRFEREEPNQLWQMDFKGMPDSRKGCLPLMLVDDHSRFMTGLYGLPGTLGESVRKSLESAFSEYGMPESMLMDHGTPWWNMQSEWGWTRLTVWLMRQGIRLCMSGYRHPQTQGKVERCNGSLEHAMRKRPKRDDETWQAWLDAFRREYNEVRPHEALGMQVPARCWRPSPRRFQGEPPRWEYPAGADVRKIGANGGVWVKGRFYFISRAFTDEYVRLEELEDRMVVSFCATPLRELDLRSGQSHTINFGQHDRMRREGLGSAPSGVNAGIG